MDTFNKILGVGVVLTALALVLRDANATTTVLQGSANAFRTTFGTFLSRY